MKRIYYIGHGRYITLYRGVWYLVIGREWQYICKQKWEDYR